MHTVLNIQNSCISIKLLGIKTLLLQLIVTYNFFNWFQIKSEYLNSSFFTGQVKMLEISMLRKNKPPAPRGSQCDPHIPSYEWLLQKMKNPLPIEKDDVENFQHSFPCTLRHAPHSIKSCMPEI